MPFVPTHPPLCTRIFPALIEIEDIHSLPATVTLAPATSENWGKSCHSLAATQESSPNIADSPRAMEMLIPITLPWESTVRPPLFALRFQLGQVSRQPAMSLAASLEPAQPRHPKTPPVRTVTLPSASQVLELKVGMSTAPDSTTTLPTASTGNSLIAPRTTNRSNLEKF